MRSSATTPYWQGRIVRAYLTSAIWNGRHGRFLKVISRVVYGSAALIMAGASIGRSGFWRAVLRPYQSESYSSNLAVAIAPMNDAMAPIP
jgi:hypothetical protein